jgi:hypothetical protein
MGDNKRPIHKMSKAERVVKYNKKDNVPEQTEVEEAETHEHATVEHLAKNVGISKIPESTSMQNWIDLIDESVHTIVDDIDIGDIEAVSRDFVVVKRGLIHIHRYYIPINKVEGWGDNVLWLKVTEDKVKANYERNIVPDPTRYYVKGFSHHYNAPTTNYPELVKVAPKYQRPNYSAQSSLSIAGTSPIYKCELCNISFNNEDELSKHVKTQH